MKLIILDAGDAFELDGYNKLLINHPGKSKRIIELYAEYFGTEKVEIVVGYKAMDVMNLYPKFSYKYNKNWQTTSSGYSLSLALSDEPCFVVPSDFILDESTVEKMSAYDNCALIKYTENRRPSSLNAQLSNEGKVESIYRGHSRNNDPEITGVFKISDVNLLSEWRKRCVLDPHGYAGENLPFDLGCNVMSVTATDKTFEINTPEDYIQFLREAYS